MNPVFKIFFLSIIAAALSGCSSFGKGIVEAVMEQQQAVDTRLCEVWGKSFNGIMPFLDHRKGKMKVLMVHGVGDHLPGYSTQFVEKLAKELDLPVMSARHKDITLTDPFDTTKNLGNLRINRLLSRNRSKELMFYELTWSVITAKQKAVLAYDNSGEYAFRRAEINDLMKKFSNDTGPDPILYLGDSREEILTSFMQSFCWLTKSDWENLPDEVTQACSFDDTSITTHIHNEHYAFISHSLGSRITIDGMQRIASLLDGRNDQFKDNAAQSMELADALKGKEIPIYMMSNQLPMLQLGRKLPDVSNQKADYCRPQGERYGQRMLTKTSIIAFSDPNDLLSYAVPQGFVEKYLDSRLCIEVTNININVATIFDAFGLGKLANPINAHIGYDTDDRVIALIAKGIGNGMTASIVKNRCRWIDTID